VDPKEEKIVIDCDVLLRSIGYQSKPMEGVIFDKKNNIIPNSNGCVLSAVVFKKNWILMNCY